MAPPFLLIISTSPKKTLPVGGSSLESGVSQNFPSRTRQATDGALYSVALWGSLVGPRRLRETNPVSEAQRSLKTEQRASPWVNPIDLRNVQPDPIRRASAPDRS